MHINAALQTHPTLPFPHCIHKPILYVCISTPVSTNEFMNTIFLDSLDMHYYSFSSLVCIHWPFFIPSSFSPLIGLFSLTIPLLAMISSWTALFWMIPRRREWQTIPVFLPGELRWQRSLAGYSPWGHKDSDMTEQLTHTHGESLCILCISAKFHIFTNAFLKAP